MIQSRHNFSKISTTAWKGNENEIFLFSFYNLFVYLLVIFRLQYWTGLLVDPYICLLCHICEKIQMHPKMWRSNLNPASTSRKTRQWLCNAMLSPTQKWCHLPGWSGLMESLKSSRTPRPSLWSRSVRLTVDNTAAEPQMQLELETLRKLWFM